MSLGAQTLVGIKEIASICGVSPPAVSNWLHRHASSFPEPAYDVPRRRLWWRADIERWAAGRPHASRGGGRRRVPVNDDYKPPTRTEVRTLFETGPEAPPGVCLFARCDPEILEQALDESGPWNPGAELNRREHRRTDSWFERWLVSHGAGLNP